MEKEGEEIFRKGGRYSALEAIWERIMKLFGFEYNSTNSLDRDGKGPLDYLYSSKPVLELVVEKNVVDINLKNKDGESSIMQAAKGGYCESFEYLADKGANLMLQDHQGKNLVHKLIESFDVTKKDEQLAIIKILKDKGVLNELLDQKDVNGKTPLDILKDNPKPDLIADLYTVSGKVHNPKPSSWESRVTAQPPSTNTSRIM
ncbi:ankyrin repeat domain-containing protein [Candidatus Bandiella euplotis]|uniref:ankyrin repeat domain-containing protein n=1 Tax=Candidatus Bandiella euplotis TaxID=1664265 RepID=UPI002B25C387|nr:hypothetical protein [Candidatus Bandiella woodruffii]